MPEAGYRARLYYEQCGNPRRQAGGVPARRPRRRHRPADAALLRPRGATASCCSTSAVRPQPPHARPGRQHHLAPGRRHRVAARAPGHRALAGVRRLLGLDARARLRPGASRARDRTGAARHLPGAPWEFRWFYESADGAPRCSPTSTRSTSEPIPPVERGQMMQAYYRRLTSDDPRGARGRARLVDLGGATSFLRMNPGPASWSSRGRLVRAGLRAHRVPLLRQRRLPSRPDQLLATCRSDPPHSRHDRAGALRRRLPDEERLGPAPRPGPRRDAAHLPTFRALGLRARDRQRAARRHRRLPLSPGQGEGSQAAGVPSGLRSTKYSPA
jgi:hypothetical protein